MSQWGMLGLWSMHLNMQDSVQRQDNSLVRLRVYTFTHDTQHHPSKLEYDPCSSNKHSIRVIISLAVPEIPP